VDHEPFIIQGRGFTSCKLVGGVIGNRVVDGGKQPEEAIEMTVVVIQQFEATPERYEAVNEKIGDAVPEGLILHTVSDLGGDKWKLVDVWESAENFQSFVQNQLIPAIAEVDPDAPQAPEPEILEVRDLQTA
jgi:hypothetical protein